MPVGLLAALLTFQPQRVSARTMITPAAIVVEIAASGRCATLVSSADDRVNSRLVVAPGQPPLLSFRLYEGRLHHGDANRDLMLDDAGH